MTIQQTYIPLRIHSPYSILEGAIQPDALAERLLAWNIPAAGIADTNSMSGAYTFMDSFVKKGLQPIHSTQVDVSHPGNEAETSQIVLIATSARGYDQISQFLSQSMTNTEPVSLRDILKPGISEDFLVLSGGPRGPIDKAIAAGDIETARRRMNTMKAALGDRFYIEVQRQSHALSYHAGLAQIALEMSIPCVATSQSWFMDKEYSPAHDVLLCIANGMTTSHDNRPKSDPNGYLKSPQEMADLFSDMPEALENTLEIARRVNFIIEKKDPVLPAFPTRHGRSETEELRAQAQEGLDAHLDRIAFDHDDQRSEHGYTRQDYTDRLLYELGVIEGMGFPGYFLIVSDFIGWAKRNDIPVGPGRGSGAGSLVAWALGITGLDPLRYGLYFERFLNPERVSMPDFDIDFCQERREEVIDYVRQKYGAERVAQIGTIGKLKAKAALRDVGRVLQIPFPVVDRFAKLVPGTDAHPIPLAEGVLMDPLAEELEAAEQDIKDMFCIAIKIEGLFRNQSTHAAGVVISDKPIDQVVPTYRDKHGILVTSYDMKSVEKAGLVKFDFLGLKTLDIIKNAADIASKAGHDVFLDPADTEDEPTYDMLRNGDSFGVFQLESAGMRKSMVQIQPTRIEDIVALVSLYRPGPMDNIPQYAAVKSGDEEAHYLHPGMKDTLEETHGIIVYQEQVMKLAQDLAGYTLGSADMLRRAMGKKIKSEMDAQRSVFEQGAEARGIPKETAREIFDLIARFANYGFNKSHAAAYAVIAYQTAYLRCHHRHAFMAATMNYDINDVEKIADAIEDARRSNLSYRGPDVNQSRDLFDISTENGDIHILHGLSALKGVGRQMARDVIQERDTNGPFRSIFDFVSRTRANINNKMMESLIRSGAFDSLHLNRAAMMATLPGIMSDAAHRQSEKERGQVTMFDFLDAPSDPRPDLPEIADWSEFQKLQEQQKIVGFYLDGHPIIAARATLSRQKNNVRIADVINHPSSLPQEISLGAVITSSTFRHTSKNKAMIVLKVSDETGLYELLAFEETAEDVRRIIKSMEAPAARFTLSVSLRGTEVGLFIRDMEPLNPEMFQ